MSEFKEETAAVDPVPEMPDEQKHSAGEEIVKSYVMWSIGAGILPMPVVNFATLSALQYSMLKKLCGIYGVQPDTAKLKHIVAVLVGGIAPAILAQSVFGLVPFIGVAMTLTTLPVLSGGSTYALGRIFVNHLESGGTVLDCDPSVMKQAFTKHFEEAKQIIPGLKKKSTAEAAPAAV